MQRYHPQRTRIEDEAAEWLARLGNPEPPADATSREQELANWLRQSEDHVRAFLDASAAFYRLDTLRTQSGDEIRKLLEAAAPNVARLPVTPTPRPRTFSWWRPIAASIAALTLIGIGYWTLQRSPSFATSVGEQRTVKLEDGSFVHLNTQSRISVDFSGSLREVTLLSGEALFDVEHDSDRPFIVRAGNTRVRAVGTSFNVYRRGDALQVAVVEGRVQVSVASAAKGVSATTAPNLTPTLLSAGEEANISQGEVAKLQEATISDAVAWRERRLVFRNTSLADVAAEFNRYNRIQMRVEGTDLKSKPLTGIFSADHPQSLILYLAEFPTLRVEPDGQDWIIRAAD
ncbi:FecR family protein [Steroidobacter sp.]|uniref:FecR family protein n=1 Tax=Steroidobacter sp. TaxID=1978227 RepID=UPI001A549B87|nr:FecR domain-containing protein [Steroidobacter sp.]MBL8271859.1 FecR domain-containing protein [Steroidobacter sp.]